MRANAIRSSGSEIEDTTENVPKEDDDGTEPRSEMRTAAGTPETEWELLQSKLKELEEKRNEPDRADDMPVSGATTPGTSSRAAARPKPRAGR